MKLLFRLSSVLGALGAFGAVASAEQFPTYRTMGYSVRSHGPSFSYEAQKRFLNNPALKCQFVDNTGAPSSTVSAYYSRSCENRKICVASVRCEMPNYSFTFDRVTCFSKPDGTCLGPKACILDGGFMDELEVQPRMPKSGGNGDHVSIDGTNSVE